VTSILVLTAVIAIGAAIPRVRATNDRRSTAWIDAWLKALVIFAYVLLLTVFLPSFVLKHEQVTTRDPLAQDLIGTGVWGIGFVAVLGTLFWAQRRGRI
jgi:hypothetical protein